MESWPEKLKPALTITYREIRDLFRDWRIIFPIVALTVFFPGLMNFTARQAVEFVQKYGANLIGDRFIPFLLMIVGFFPTTVSLVIALESFAGETERRSIEPLLSSPLADWQLYLGKLLASIIPPVLASFLGIATYLFGVYRSVQWTPPTELLAQVIMLTLVQTLVMVSGAVVISTQTTSVRAANLLSSFIVIPVSLLIQVESIVMFWGGKNTLWWIVFGMSIVAGLLIRAGIAHFNREDLLGREIDVIDLGRGWRVFWQAFIGKARNPLEWYTKEVWPSLKKLAIPLLAMIVLLPIGLYIGVDLAERFRLPANLLNLDKLQEVNSSLVPGLRAVGFLSLSGAFYIWLHNLRVVLIATALGIFTFGVGGPLILMLPMIVLGYLAQASAVAGFVPLEFLGAFTLPHGYLEFPAMILTGAAIMRVGATMVTPGRGESISEGWLRSMADWARLMIAVVMPLFLAAALLETFVTPYTLIQYLGR